MIPSFSQSQAAGGTLVVMVPTKAGLVIAADSRVTFGTGIACDDEYKITELANVDRTALVVTGTSNVTDTRPLIGKPMAGICEHVRRLPRKFDANTLVKKIIEEQPLLATEKFDALPSRCSEAVKAFMATEPGVFDTLRGSSIFQVGLGSYSPDERTSFIRSFNVVMSGDGEIETINLKVQQFQANEGASLSPFGEVSFLMDHVFNGPGLKFLGERYGRFRSQQNSKIADIEIKVAADLASDLIEAASRTSQFVPARTGIGGPVDILLVGEEPRPVRLQWK